MRPIPAIATDFIAQHEGVRLTAYRDGAGAWTIGYGSTCGVTTGMVITEAEARRRLASDLEASAQRIRARIGPVADELTDHQYAALLSLVFNVGAGPGWTLWKRLRARQFDQVPGELIKFVNAGGRKVQGLVNRRADEVKLWSTEEPGSSPAVLPSSETRTASTPPTPADPTPPARSAHVIAGALAVAGAVPGAAKTVVDTLTPWREAAPILVHAIEAAGLAGAVAAVTVLVLNVLRQMEARG